MNFLKATLFLIIILTGLVSCGEKDKEAKEVDFDDIKKSIGTSVTAAGGAADDADDAASSKKNNKRACSFSWSSSGTPPTCSVSNISCSNSRGSLVGDVSFTYSAGTDCVLSNDGDGESAIRTHDFTYTLSSGLLTGWKVMSTSSTETSYNNEAIGGGATVTYNSTDDYTLAISGVNRFLQDTNGTNWVNASIRTASGSPLALNKFARTNRIISGGTLEIVHNNAQFTASHVYNNVTWGDDSCCYPTSGSITSTFTDAITGSGTVTFSGGDCGAISISKDGNSKSYTLSGDCEK